MHIIQGRNTNAMIVRGNDLPDVTNESRRACKHYRDAIKSLHTAKPVAEITNCLFK